MRLQSDPTILYGLTGGKTVWSRPIQKIEIMQKTAHNTYQIDGLPPTPICNPGRAAIEAVLNPADTKDLYFVADGSGGHVFAETLKDHNANVLKWRAAEKDKMKGTAPAADDTPDYAGCPCRGAAQDEDRAPSSTRRRRPRRSRPPTRPSRLRQRRRWPKSCPGRPSPSRERQPSAAVIAGYASLTPKSSRKTR